MQSLRASAISTILPLLLAFPAPFPASAASDEPVSVGALPAQQAAPGPGAEQAPPTLEELRWVARPLVIFADTENDPRFRQQMELLTKYTEDLAVRDVVVLVDTDAGVLSPLRRELRPRDFTVVLIDKDGTVVQRRPAPTTVREISRTIDRLPSRRQETDSLRP